MKDFFSILNIDRFDIQAVSLVKKLLSYICVKKNVDKRMPLLTPQSNHVFKQNRYTSVALWHRIIKSPGIYGLFKMSFYS